MNGYYYTDVRHKVKKPKPCKRTRVIGDGD